MGSGKRNHPGADIAARIGQHTTAVARDMNVGGQRRHAESEPPVDRLLRRPQIGNRLVARAAVVEEAAHQPGQDSLAPVRRQNANHRKTGRLHMAARRCQREWKRSAAAGKDIAVARDKRTARRHELREVGNCFFRRDEAEIMPDRRDGGADVLRGLPGRDRDGHRVAAGSWGCRARTARDRNCRCQTTPAIRIVDATSM